jgi:endonuclease/exonuclease/phosphatase (EEP) superfamily protein YafD
VSRVATVLLAAFALLVLVEVSVNALLGPQEGPLALAAVFEPWLLSAGTVAGLLATVLSLGSGRAGAPIRLLGVAIIVVALVRLGGEWWSPEPVGAAGVGPSGSAGGGGEPRAAALSVLSWNLEVGSKAAASTVAGIIEADADLVALQELTPDAAAAIEADRTLLGRYPYRILEARDGVAGLGLLGKRPLVVGSYATGPLILRAGLLLPDGRTVQVLNVHPYPPAISMVAGFPSGLDTRRRDADLLAIRDAVLALPDPDAALVIGDLNTTPFEAGFRTLAASMSDAHAEAGSGTGFTWRPSSLEGLHVGLLRLDHVLTGAWLKPLEVHEECAIPGDHCQLLVTLDVGG